MVTNWNGYWDKLRDNKSSYNYFMLKDGMNQSKLKDNTPTIFIKLNGETREIEKVWNGRINDIKKTQEKIYFKVSLDREIKCPKKYIDYSEGWYYDQDEIEIGKPSVYDPPFFNTLLTTNNWSEFENLTYYLLKILGIHEILKYEEQRGEADGFFKFENLAVIYDTTLDMNFRKSKFTQIRNFCSQLNKSEIIIDNKEIPIERCFKNVWIITRSDSPQLIKTVGNIKVKEIPINSLIKIHHKRMSDEFDLEKELQNL